MKIRITIPARATSTPDPRVWEIDARSIFLGPVFSKEFAEHIKTELGAAELKCISEEAVHEINRRVALQEVMVDVVPEGTPLEEPWNRKVKV